MVVAVYGCGSSGSTRDRSAPLHGRVVQEELIAMPVRSSRAWTSALAPNRRGGWNFITQIYDVGSSNLPQFVVVDLDTGKTTTTPGIRGIYANSNYQVSEQLRARNGRIFFPQLENHLAYYDPQAEQVKQLGRVVTTSEDKAIYRVAFGPDGKLYGGTQSNGLPTIFELDPDTLSHHVLGKVGRKRNGYSYAYYLAPDPPWVYVVVGQDPWELVALNIRTRTSKVLATVPADGFIELETGPRGISAKLVSKLRRPDQRSTRMWCVDGELVSTVAPRGQHSIARAVVGTLVDSPEVDLASVTPNAVGISRLRWRPRDSARWHETSFQTVEPAAVGIDSLVALPDGTLFGSAMQYHGFFRVDPRAKTVERFEGVRLSGGPRAVVGNRVYFAGYPNSLLYAYDIDSPWNSQLPVPNPARIGNFEQARAHYPYALVPSRTGRIFFAGRRERTGQGGAIGYFDPRTSRFAGTHDGLEHTTPRGLVVLEPLDWLIYSGRDDTGRAARLVVFDRELRELERIRVMSGMKSTGIVYPTRTPNIIVGVSAEDQVAYRFDVARRKLLGIRRLAGAVATTTQRSDDGSLWLVTGGTLSRLDVATLELVSKGPIATPSSEDVLVWQGDRLYRTHGGGIYEIVFAE
jgi:hypothetical protein